MSVVLVYDLFDGGGYKNVALLVKHVLAFVGLSAGETDYRTVLDSVVLQGLDKFVDFNIASRVTRLDYMEIFKGARDGIKRSILIDD